LLHKKRNETVCPPPNGTVAKDNPALGHPNRARRTVRRKKFGRNTDGSGSQTRQARVLLLMTTLSDIIFVIIKKLKMPASRGQHEQLLKVMGNKLSKIVRLQDVFVCDLSVYSLYESLENPLMGGSLDLGLYIDFLWIYMICIVSCHFPSFDSRDLWTVRYRTSIIIPLACTDINLANTNKTGRARPIKEPDYRPLVGIPLLATAIRTASVHHFIL
jgi:hypothetical protein